MSQVAVLEYFDRRAARPAARATARAPCRPSAATRPRSSRSSPAAASRSTPACSPRYPNARVAITGSTGYDHMDLDDLRAAGVAAYCTPDYCTREVADFALACALAGLRGIVGLDRAMQAGVWEERAAGETHRVRGSVLGVIGLGKIGSLVARDAAALGMRVLASDPVASDEAFAAAGAERAELDELLAASDVVTLHAPYVRGSQPLLGARGVRAASSPARSSSTPRAPSCSTSTRCSHGLARGRPGLGVHGRLGRRAAAARRPSPRRAQPDADAARRLVLARGRRRRSTSASPRSRPPRCAARPRGG